MFQKRSTKGIATPQKDVDRIRGRYRTAKQIHLESTERLIRFLARLRCDVTITKRVTGGAGRVGVVLADGVPPKRPGRPRTNRPAA